MHLRSEDAGMYTVKAINRQGEAVSQAAIQVATRGTVTGEDPRLHSRLYSALKAISGIYT